MKSAERDAARVGRENQQSVERKARRDKAGRAARAKNDAPKILLDAKKERAEASAGRGRLLALRKPEAADEALAEAQGGVERLRAFDILMPPTGLAAGKLVLRLEGKMTSLDGERLFNRVRQLGKLIGREPAIRS